MIEVIVLKEKSFGVSYFVTSLLAEGPDQPWYFPHSIVRRYIQSSNTERGDN
jgi:hypothetical protein